MINYTIYLLLTYYKQHTLYDYDINYILYMYSIHCIHCILYSNTYQIKLVYVDVYVSYKL